MNLKSKGRYNIFCTLPDVYSEFERFSLNLKLVVFVILNRLERLLSFLLRKTFLTFWLSNSLFQSIKKSSLPVSIPVLFTGNKSQIENPILYDSFEQKSFFPTIECYQLNVGEENRTSPRGGQRGRNGKPVPAYFYSSLSSLNNSRSNSSTVGMAFCIC